MAESLINFRGELLNDFIVEGHTVFACAPNASESIKNELLKMGVIYRNVKISRVGMNPLYDFVLLLSMINKFRSIKADVFIGYTIKPVIYGSIAARFVGVPRIYSIITGLGYAFIGETVKSKVIRILVSYLYAFALQFNKKVFFQNNDDSQLFQKRKFVNKDQVVVLNGSGVNIEKFSITPFPEELSFLLIARLLKDKGVYEYIKASRVIKTKYPKVQFCLVGWIDENPSSISKDDLQSWINEGLVDYLGKMTDVRPAISGCSVYVLPSYREGTPRTVLEAMAMGRPIITTDAPGCRDTVCHGSNGFLVPVRDTVILAQMMERFVENRVLIEKMGKKSRKIAEKKYDVRKVNQIIIKNLGL